ncbi:MAG: hypothetical protein ACOCQ3_00475 [Natronomonas sp.]
MGAVAGGAGLIGGTGAFTTVEAERTVDVTTSGDSSANLQLDGDSEVTGTEDEAGVDVLTINNDDINERARTVFGDAITVTNNGTNDVGFYVEDSVSPMEFEVDGSSIVGSGDSEDLNSGTSLDIDVIIDLTGSEDGTDLDAVDEVSFIADTASHSGA